MSVTSGELLTPVLGVTDNQSGGTEGSILFPHVAPMRQYITEQLTGEFDAATQHRLEAIINGLLIDNDGYGELAKLIRKREYLATHGDAESPNVLQEVQQGFDFLLGGMKDGLSADVQNPLREIDALTKTVEQRQDIAGAPPFAREMYGKGMIYGLVASGCVDKGMYKVPLQFIADAVGQDADAAGVKEPRQRLRIWRMMMSDYTNKYGYGMFVQMRWPHILGDPFPFELISAGEDAADEIVFGSRLLENPESTYARELMIEVARQELEQRAENDPRRKYFQENLPNVLTRSNIWPDNIKSVPAADYLAWLFQNEERQWASVEDGELFSQLASQLIVQNIKVGNALEDNDSKEMGTLLRKIVWQVGYGLRKASLATPLIPDQDLKDFAPDEQRQIITAYGVGRIAAGSIRDGIDTLKSLAETRGQTVVDIVSALRPILDTIKKNMQTDGTPLHQIATVLGTAEQLSAFLATPAPVQS